MSLDVDKRAFGAMQLRIDGVLCDLSKYDVLCGKGDFVYNQNTPYRKLVQVKKAEYVTCPNNKLKNTISRSIVETIQKKKGRFLRKEEDSDSWYEIDDKKAILKTSQALREKPKPKQLPENPKPQQNLYDMRQKAYDFMKLTPPPRPNCTTDNSFKPIELSEIEIEEALRDNESEIVDSLRKNDKNLSPSASPDVLAFLGIS